MAAFLASPLVWTLSGFAVLLLLIAGLLPRSTRVTGDELRIISLLHTWHIPLASILRVEPARLPPGTLRLAAAGWPLPPSGWFWNRTLGRFPALADSRRDLHFLYLRNGSRLLVSLHNTPALLR